MTKTKLYAYTDSLSEAKQAKAHFRKKGIATEIMKEYGGYSVIGLTLKEQVKRIRLKKSKKITKKTSSSLFGSGLRMPKFRL